MTRAGPSVPDGTVLVLFGVTGDLAKRKLLPGLFYLDAAGLMPHWYRIVGPAPTGAIADTTGFKDLVHETLVDFGRKEVTDDHSDHAGADPLAPADAVRLYHLLLRLLRPVQPLAGCDRWSRAFAAYGLAGGASRPLPPPYLARRRSSVQHFLSSSLEGVISHAW